MADGVPGRHLCGQRGPVQGLGNGFRQGKWTDVEVVHDELGAPQYRLYGVYAEAVREKSCQPPSLSIAHDGDYAVAFVVL